MKKFKGLYPALVTPYDRNGKVDDKKAQKLVEHLLDCGVDGFYIGGSTGESYLLSMQERKQMLEAVVEAADGKAEVIANIGVFATEHGIELAKHAQKTGVAAISSVQPFYFSFNMEEYIRDYEDLADAVDVPVLIYNIPAMSGIHFSKSDLERLLSNEKIIGIKHTSYDLFQLQQIIEEHPDKSVFIGHDELYLSALAVGVQAGIGSTFNIMAGKFQRLNQLFAEKKLEEALKVQGEVNAVVEVLCKVGVFKGIKEILKLQGFDCGDCRRPFLPLTENEKELVKETARLQHLI